MGGCCSCDESQQITGVCGSFHQQLQISIKTESGAGRTAVAIILSPLLSLSLSSPPTSTPGSGCCPTMLWTSLSQLILISLLCWVDLPPRPPSPLLFTPPLHNSPLNLISSNIFLIISRLNPNQTCNPSPPVTQRISNVIFCQLVIITDY